MIIDTIDKQMIYLSNVPEQLSELIFNGFKNKFTAKLFKDSTAKDIAYLLAKYVSSSKKEQLIIARQDDEICGCLFYSDDQDHSLYELIKKEYSGFMKIKVFLFFLVLEHRPVKNETYVEFLVGSDQHRRRGVGTQLIQKCKDIAITKKVTLYVAANNTSAIDLYQKNDFRTQIVQSSMLSGKIINNKKWYFMTWENLK